MANYVSKIKINGVTANIKDAPAQNSISALTASLNAEIQNRIAGDELLQNNVNALQNSIDNIDKHLSHIGYVNILDFGAKGDGVTDDTTAFRNAIEYCITNNKGLYVPAVGEWDNDGGYILSKTLNIDYPMVFICEPNVVMNWKNAHNNKSTGTSVGRNNATLYESGFGINIDYGSYSGHKGYYRFGIIQGDKSYTAPGGTVPSGHYWTGTRIANGDIVDYFAMYISYWAVGIEITSTIDYTGNNKIVFDVCDDCQTGVLFNPTNNNAIDLTELYFNTIGLCKYGIAFKSDGTQWARVNNLRVRGSQIYVEYLNGHNLYGYHSNPDVITHADIDIMTCANNQTAETTRKTGDTSGWYAPVTGGLMNCAGSTSYLGATNSKFKLGVYNGTMSAGSPIMIYIGGYGNEIINTWRNMQGTLANPIKLSLTNNENNFNGGVGGALTGRNAFVQLELDKDYSAGEELNAFAYAICLSGNSDTPITLLPMECYDEAFDYYVKSDVYNGQRQIYLKFKFKQNCGRGWQYNFILHIESTM